MSDIHYKHALH